MHPLYAIGIIETVKLISQSNIGRSVKKKIGLNNHSDLHTKIDSLEARMWELEQMIHKLCKLYGGNNA
jgi:hypothetical protein